MNFFESLESLTKINEYLMILALFIGLAGALFGLLYFFKRKSKYEGGAAFCSIISIVLWGVYYKFDHQKEKLSTIDLNKKLSAIRVLPKTRRITEYQNKIIYPFLQKANGQNIKIVFLSSDNEANEYANQLISLFKKSGWIVASIAVKNIQRNGLTITFSSNYKGRGLSAIGEAFQQASVGSDIVYSEGLPESKFVSSNEQVVMFVGPIE